MKAIVTAIVALGVLSGIAATANAEPFNAKSFFEQLSRDRSS